MIEQTILKGKVPYKIPDNWVWIKFTQAIDIRGGSQPPKIFFSNEQKKDYIRFIQIRDFSNDKNITYIPKTSNLTYVNKKDILIARYGASLGKICRGIDGACNVALVKTVFNDRYINNDFLYFFLQSEIFQRPLSMLSRTAQNGFNKEDLSFFPFPLPPINEQQRIATCINTFFHKLDQVKEILEKAFESFEGRKAQVLNQAFSGELTKKWRKAMDIKFDWRKDTFENLCYLNRGFDLPAKKRIEGKFPLVSSGGETDTHNEYKVRGPGVVTGRSGTIGKVYYIENNYWPLNTTLYSKDFNGNFPKYVFYYLSIFDFKKHSSSTAVPTLNRNNFKQEIVNIPTFQEQQEIVRILDSVFEKENRSKELLNCIDQVEVMKKSILAKAFRGKLGTNNSEDEPAIELLKRILEEKRGKR